MGPGFLRRLVVMLTGATLLGIPAPWRATLRAAELPLTRFARVDGLADDGVTALRQDSRGFLWIGTAAGASRFDGVRFRTYTVADGMAVYQVNAIAETRDGRLWFATNGGGIASFDPEQRRGAEPPSFTRYRLGETRPPNRVNLLLEDRDGTRWAATDSGLFALRTDSTTFTRVGLLRTPETDAQLFIPDAALAADGALWLATSAGLVRHDPRSGRTTTHVFEGLAAQSLTRVVVDPGGLVWATSTEDLRLFRPPAAAAASDTPVSSQPCLSGDTRVIGAVGIGQSCAISSRHGLPDGRIIALAITGDARVLVGTSRGGVAEIVQGRLRTIDRAHDRYAVTALLEDHHRNIWLGTDGGVVRLARDGFITYDTRDGLAERVVRRVFGNRDGAVYAMTEGEAIHVFDQRGFRGTRPRFPAGATVPTWRSSHVPDPAGGWWVPTSAGLCHYPGTLETLDQARPDRCYDQSDGLPSGDIALVMPDSRGNLWVGTQPSGGDIVAVRVAGHAAFTRLAIEGRSSPSSPLSFLEDSEGGIWAGLRDGGVARCDARRCVERLITSTANALLIDRHRRLWIGTATGLLRIDDRHATRLTIARAYTEADGLSNRWIYALVEDERGRLYVGTSVGLDRFDPATATVRHFSTVDGLAAGQIHGAFRDQAGRFWFATRHGVSMYSPGVEEAPAVSPPRIAGLRSGDRVWPVADTGDSDVQDVELASRDVPLEIELIAIDMSRRLRLQHRLRGLEHWRDAGANGRIVYAGLASGGYAFEARTVAENGAASDAATVEFRVPRPAWQRWPALVTAALVGVALVYTWYRVRVSRLIALERVRTRIASDLHDDIGSNLSRIAVLAEVARRRGRAQSGDAAGPLETIAVTSRDLVDTMSDIVWAVNPRHDSFGDLTYRMRRFTEDMLGAAGVAVTFRAPVLAANLPLGADVRREVYRVLKESVTNSVRHSGTATASVTLEIERDRLRLTVADQGRGFDPATVEPGNGLLSMRRRTQRLGGTVDIRSAPGLGTTLVFEVPIDAAAGGTRLRDRVAGWMTVDKRY